jgi:MFS superfamily sulfate permease-like transporter
MSSSAKSSDVLSLDRRENLRFDVPAGLVVFLVAVPLSLGIAMASGAPLQAGLVAGVIGGLVVGALSGSEVSVAGPAAGLAVVVLQGLRDTGSFSSFCAATALAGVLQMGFAALRLGGIGRMCPHSVIKGMLAAIGALIILGQVPHGLGRDLVMLDDAQAMSNLPQGIELVRGVIAAARAPVWGAIAVFAAAMGVSLGWERLPAGGPWTRLPGPLVGVLAGWALQESFRVVAPGLALGAEHLVQLPQMVPSAWVGALPAWDVTAFGRPVVWQTAALLAVIASVESLLSVEAADRIDPFRRISDLDRELFAQGVGNALCGLLGGLPVASVVVRTSTNVYQGARTRTATWVHGASLALAALLLGSLLSRVPLAAIAAVLVSVGAQLVRPTLFRSAYAMGRAQFVPFLVTFVGVLATDLLRGVALGLLVGMAFALRSNFHSAITVISDGNDWLVRFTKDVSFVHKPRLQSELAAIPNGASVFIDGTRATYVDQDVEDVLREYLDGAPRRGIHVTTKNLFRSPRGPR